MRKVSTLQDVAEVDLTIYNNGFGAVKEIRNLNLTGDETEVVFTDVAQGIQTDSVLVEGLKVLMLSYDYGMTDRFKLLRRYIDKEVYLKNKETGEKISCRLLAVEAGSGKCIFEDIRTKEIYLDPEAEIILPHLPSEFTVKPALYCQIEKAEAKDVIISYLCGGFSWQTNYAAVLQEKTLTMTGWARIKNQSGTTFKNAKIKLIAGEVKKTRGIVKTEESRDSEVRGLEKSKKSLDNLEKDFFEYHMYVLDQPVTLSNFEEKQINILNIQGVPYKKYYQLNRVNKKTEIIVEVENKKENGLGFVIPKGTVKFYKQDQADNFLEFIGEDFLNHTATDEKVQMVIGEAFDISFEYKKEEVKKQWVSECHKVEWTIKNHKKEKITVHFEDHIPGIWRMLYSSHDYVKPASDLIKFIINVPEEGIVNVTYEYKRG